MILAFPALLLRLPKNLQLVSMCNATTTSQDAIFYTHFILHKIPTVFLYFIYRSQPPKMLKYVKKFENKRPVLPPTHHNSPIAEVRLPSDSKQCWWVRFYNRDARPSGRCELRRVLDHYFNVRLGVSRR